LLFKALSLRLTPHHLPPGADCSRQSGQATETIHQVAIGVEIDGLAVHDERGSLRSGRR